MLGSHHRIRRASRTVGVALTGLSATLAVAGLAFGGTSSATPEPLCINLDQATGITGFSSFSLFTPGSATISNPVDIQGAAAIGGKATLKNYTVDSANASPLPDGYSFVAPEVAANSKVIITGGNYAYEGSPVTLYNNGSGKRTPASGVTDANPIDFASAWGGLTTFASNLAASTSNMTLKTTDTTHRTLTGTSSVLDVFNTHTNQLAPNAGSTLDIQAPAGATVVINIQNSGVLSLTKFATINLIGVSPTTVIWNFVNATSITAGPTQWKGTILATKATLHYSSAQVDGSVYVAGLSGSTEIHYYPFGGALCPVTTTTTAATTSTTGATTSSTTSTTGATTSSTTSTTGATTSSTTSTTQVPTSVTSPSLSSTTTTNVATTVTSPSQGGSTTTTGVPTSVTSPSLGSTTTVVSTGGTESSSTTVVGVSSGASAPSSSITVPATNTGEPWSASIYWAASGIAGLFGFALLFGRRPKTAEKH